MKKFLKGFVYAGKGVAWAVIHERNMRFHITLSIYMFCYLLIYDFFQLNKIQWTLIVLATAIVFGAELFNTAIEKTVDLASKEKTELGKIAKDTAAGAVLMCAAGALVTGLIILWQPEAFRKMFEYYRDNIHMLIILIVSLVPSGLYVFRGFDKK